MRRWGDMLAWLFFGFAVLSLAAWPLMVWWHVTTGTPPSRPCWKRCRIRLERSSFGLSRADSTVRRACRREPSVPFPTFVSSRSTRFYERRKTQRDAEQSHDPLGRVDGFNQDEAECKGYEGSVVLRGLLASERDAFEALEFADGLLDACPRLVEYFRKECRSIDRV